MEKKNRIADGNPRTPNLGISLIPIVAIFVLLYGSLRIFHLDVQIPLIFASIIAAFIVVVILKNKWDTIEKGIIDSIQNAMQAILIACFIGMIIGSWIAGGIVPSLIYYGLKILSPKFFLVTCLLVHRGGGNGKCLDHRGNLGRCHGGHRFRNGNSAGGDGRCGGIRSVLRG